MGYANWNRKATRLLWVLVVIGLVASLPLAAQRAGTELSSKKVEVAFDYRDLLEIANYKPDPQQYVSDQLGRMKTAGIKSLAVYETTLSELALSGRVEVYSAREAAGLLQSPEIARENATYVLFTDKAAEPTVRPMIEETFAKLHAATHSWNFKQQNGIVIDLPQEDAVIKPMDPDPIAIRALRDEQFQVIARLSNRRAFDSAAMDKLLGRLQENGVQTIVVDGESVPGFAADPEQSKIRVMAELMNKHGMSLGAAEMVKNPNGIGTLAKDLQYNVIRLHSFTEQDTDKLAAANLPPDELANRERTLADSMVLAVKDRNVRILFINAHPTKNMEKGGFADPMASIYHTLDGSDGATQRIRHNGFTVGEGPAHAFLYQPLSFEKPLKLLVMVGSVALVALTISSFAPGLTLAIFLLGLIGTAGLYVLSPDQLLRLLALAAAVCAATLSMITAIDLLRRMRAADQTPKAKLGTAVLLLLRTTFLSLIGAAFVVGLLNHITYNLLLNQFLGVKILAYLPLVLVGLYVLFFSEPLDRQGRIEKANSILLSKVSVLWIVAAAVVAGASYYLLSRTGNEGQASSLEMAFRGFLENTLQVRPRTKEFLIGHPFFILGVFLWLKYRWNALYIVMIGAIAQADVVGTFTHLHTPLYISAIRVGYGLLFGIVIGFGFVAVWELCARGWKRWAKTA